MKYAGKACGDLWSQSMILEAILGGCPQRGRGLRHHKKRERLGGISQLDSKSISNLGSHNLILNKVLGSKVENKVLKITKFY